MTDFLPYNAIDACLIQHNCNIEDVDCLALADHKAGFERKLKQKLKCELVNKNIKNYNVSRNINLEIYGWGSGKFTNNQYFGTNSFNINTNGNQLKYRYIQAISTCPCLRCCQIMTNQNQEKNKRKN